MPDPHSKNGAAYRWFKNSLVAAILAVFVLIFLGALVRATGSGMGCPDWPKCYGQWVPPTDVSQLPADYQERFAAPGKPVALFNVYHTYTEYVNRLFGVLTGLFVTAALGFSFLYFRSKPSLFWLSLAACLLTGFQGWIGAKVVDTNLAGYMVTLHMFLALLILGLLVLAYYIHTRNEQPAISPGSFKARHLVFVLLLISLVQILSGTQVREIADHSAAMGLGDRSSWLKSLEGILGFHKLFSLVVCAIAAWLFWKYFRLEASGSMVYRAGVVMIISLLAQMLTGLMNAGLNLPPASQVLHLWFGSTLFGALLLLSLRLYTAAVKEPA